MIKAAYAGIQKFFEENKERNEGKEESERKETSQMPDEKSLSSNAQNDSALSSRENIAQSEDENKRNKKAANKGERSTSAATLVSALATNLKREPKQKGTLIFDRSASLSSVSNNRPAQNGAPVDNVENGAQSATEKSNVPNKNVTQSEGEGKRKKNRRGEGYAE